MKKIYIWLEKGKVYKAVLDKNTLRIYDNNDVIILKRTNLNALQIRAVSDNISKYGLKKLKGLTLSEFFRGML